MRDFFDLADTLACLSLAMAVIDCRLFLRWRVFGRLVSVSIVISDGVILLIGKKIDRIYLLVVSMLFWLFPDISRLRLR